MWKAQYSDVEFVSPDQDQMETAISEAKELLARKGHLKLPVALPVPRGRPRNDGGKRALGYREKNLNKKVARRCGACAEMGHNRGKCPYKQA